MIHTIGDSHADFSFRGIPNVIRHNIGMVTMESVGKDRKGKSSSEILDDILQQYAIQDEDIVILCFGEIDARCIIYPKIEKEDINTVINLLVAQYFATILRSKHKNYWIMSVVPAGYYMKIDHAFPYLGSDEERSIYTQKINKILKEQCLSLSIPFLDIYSLYKDEKGMLQKEYSIDGCHINNTSFIFTEMEKYISIKHKFKSFPNKVFLETGSYLGDGIQAALDANCFEDIYSIELSSKYYEICKHRFIGNSKVHLFLGDSIIVLPELLKVINDPCTFWIDAHFSGGKTACGDIPVPMMQELEIIASHYIKTHTILVDDIRAVGTGGIETDWGKLNLEEIEQLLYSINPDYSITYGFGIEVHDILIAQIK